MRQSWVTIGKYEKVNVIKRTVATVETALVEFKLRSMNGQVNTVIEALTISDVTGDLKTVSWKAINRNWDHLKGVNFTQVNSRNSDILTGRDYPDFHFSLKDIRRKPGQTIDRLTLLGLTCIGNPNNSITN